MYHSKCPASSATARSEAACNRSHRTKWGLLLLPGGWLDLPYLPPAAAAAAARPPPADVVVCVPGARSKCATSFCRAAKALSKAEFK